MPTDWKHNVAENMQFEYTAEQKAKFPMDFLSLNIICHCLFCIFKHVSLSSTVVYFPGGRRSQRWSEVSFGLKSGGKKEQSGLSVVFCNNTQWNAYLWFKQLCLYTVYVQCLANMFFLCDSNFFVF